MRSRPRLVVALAVVLVAAGCLGSPGGPAETTATDSPTATDSSTPTPTGESTATRTERTTTPTTTPIDSTSASSETTQRTKQACNGSFVSFYRLSEDVVWDPGRVPVGVSLGAGGNVTVAVFENDTLLGTVRSTAPSDTGAAADGLPIHLKTELSGTHTIRVVAYPNTNGNGRFDPETATPCRRDGVVVRTESRTIDFSKFTDDSAATAEPPTEVSTPAERPTSTIAPDDIVPTTRSTTTYPVAITVAELSNQEAKERALAAEEEYITERFENATCLVTWGFGGTVEERATVTNRTADSVVVNVTHPYSYREEMGTSIADADGGTSARYVITSESTRRVRGDSVSPCR